MSVWQACAMVRVLDIPLRRSDDPYCGPWGVGRHGWDTIFVAVTLWAMLKSLCQRAIDWHDGLGSYSSLPLWGLLFFLSLLWAVGWQFQ